jgi:acetylornithine deacetylase/succinyl-diaminopimelate desuccinylase-like protein
VPAAVRSAAADPRFLDCQPNLVLRLGDPAPHARTVMFNAHLDTVAGVEPVGFDGSRFTGRGAIDAKGPAVALLAGIRGALAADPRLGERISVLVQAVSGEEGGALGTFGTRTLIGHRFHGRLNVFCEPTGLRYLPRATAAMTARLRVRGEDAVDDRPEQGHNATVLLGFLAQHLAFALAAPSDAANSRVCVAGLHTGPLHNRVYGTGDLLVNISYPTAEAARLLEAAVTDAVQSGLRAFTERFAHTRALARTARDAQAVVTLAWEKRGMPALADAGPWAERLLRDAGVDRTPDGEPAFTCDAIWLAEVPDAAGVVLGPGSLDANHPHARGEYADLADLDAFADQVTRVLLVFAASVEKGQP